MNTSSSDFSSGCESGWTQYFVKSSSSPAKSKRTGSMKMMCGDGDGDGNYFEEERYNCYGVGGEDLSMVSDASSGPRQCNDVDDESCFNNRNESPSYRNDASESKLKKNKNGKQREKSQLDDTASSHSKSNNKQPSMYCNNLSHGQENSGASLTKGRPSRKKYFGS